jgi:hypothetical protein
VFSDLTSQVPRVSSSSLLCQGISDWRNATRLASLNSLRRMLVTAQENNYSRTVHSPPPVAHCVSSFVRCKDGVAKTGSVASAGRPARARIDPGTVIGSDRTCQYRIRIKRAIKR